MRSGGEKRGNSKDRRARKRFLLVFWGNGVEVPCVHCHTLLTYDTVEADRIIPGGSYQRGNVQPSCRTCNAQRSSNPQWLAQAA